MNNELDIYNRIIARWDAWAQQMKTPDEKGRYGYTAQKRKLTIKDIDNSLTSNKITIGAYTVTPVSNTVVFPVIDVDNHDGKTDVIKDTLIIYTELQKKGVYPFIEASSGAIENGAHIGMICRPTDAGIVKTFLTDVLTELKLQKHEVFPKQTEVDEVGYGNLVKLPFQYNNRTQQRSEIISPDTMKPFKHDEAVKYLLTLPDSVFNSNSNGQAGTKKPEINKVASLPGAFSSIDQLLSKPKIKPCIVNAYREKWVLHGIGDEGHVFRGAVVGELLSWGATDAELLKYLSLQSDYSEKTSRKQIELIRGKQLRPTSCKRLLEQCPTILGKLCSGCNYYKKPKKTRTKDMLDPVVSRKEYHWSDLGNAQRIKDMFGKDIRYCHATKQWLIWDSQRWNINRVVYVEEVCARRVIKQLYDEAFVINEFEKKKEMIEFALKCESTQKIKNMCELTKSEPGIPILPAVLDNDPMLFNVQNGTIDLKTGKIKAYNKTDFITRISPVMYDPTAQCPIWISFLNKIFAANTELIEYMQRKAGYIMTGLTSEEEFDEFYGTGNNGKSKYVNQILHIMGEYQVKANVETIQAASDRTGGNTASSDVARLKGMRLVTISEPAKGTQLNEQRVKDWTGRDPITARHLYQEPITFMPEFKLWVYTNYKLRIRGTDNAIWRRIKLVPFEVTISEEEQDKNLDKKLLIESSGILNWMIEGCIKWQEDGLKVPKEIIEATEEYREDQDYLGEFFKQCCDIKTGEKCSFKSVFLVYRAYCRIFDMPTQGRISFIDTLDSKKFKKVHEERGSFYHGFRLNCVISGKYQEMISSAGYGEADALTQMSQFLTTFLAESIREEVMKLDILPSAPSASSSLQCDNEEKVNSVDINDFTRMTELTKIIFKAQAVFGRENGVINSSNINRFSLWFCELYHPKWINNGETGDYQPSAIRGIASKLFKLTPAPGAAHE